MLPMTLMQAAGKKTITKTSGTDEIQKNRYEIQLHSCLLHNYYIRSQQRAFPMLASLLRRGSFYRPMQGVWFYKQS